MRIKTVLAAALIFLLPAIIMAQDLSTDDIRRAEWELKYQHFNQMQKHQNYETTLDQADYDVAHCVLDVDVADINGQIIYGNVTMTSVSAIDGLTEADYNFNTVMSVDSVFIDNQPASYTHASHMLNITLDRAYDNGEPFTTIVYYHGHPPSTGFGSFMWQTHNGQPIIWSFSCPESARDWWPCKDMPHDKLDSADVIITVPDDLTATSNGVLVSDVDNGNGTRTFHWDISYPISTYLIMLSISNYSSFTDWYVNVDGDSMPIVNYVYPEHYDDAVEDFNITASAIEFYVSLFGEYPFFNEKFGHSIFNWAGGMEHQCNVSYSSMFIRGNHAYDFVLVHELSHMWFGDMITQDIFPEVWMNEGFASYCEALWAEHISGFEGYIDYMTSSNRVNYPSGPIYDPYPLYDGNTVYNKGSWVLHMLRGVMGDEAFFEGMHAYAADQRFMYGTITTREFQAVMEQYYGADLSWYFDQWIWEVNRPWYRYSWLAEDIGGGQFEIFLHISQVQPEPAPEFFIMPIKIYPRINSQDTIITIYNDSREDDFRFIVDGEPTDLQFDKDVWVLKYSTSEDYGMNIVTTELPDGNIDNNYNETIEARGGQMPYIFSIQDGSLPSGLELNENTGNISGIPVAEGEYAFTIRCADSSNPVETDDQDYVVNIYNQSGINYPEKSIPSNFVLIENYPNPFNSSTVISLRLAEPGYIALDIYNIAGQKVAGIHQGYLSAGRHDIIWQANSVSSGIYFARLTTGQKSDIRKMTLLK
ncbi:MAG: T9SS type A sorting domain-containing protein [candidate division Zixibacteria bacterium]|nr:T9SS type A sorting domain-containing protein [candidate division Zixibacteria bacterium]